MSTKRKILVTQALPYANGTPHLGHLVGMIQTDIWVRLQKMLGHDCLFVCGSDSHGTPIMIQAEKNNETPEKMIKRIQKEQEQDFADFGIGFDNYYTTHSEENKILVETIFKRHVEQGNIEKRTIKQAYDPVKNMFLPDRYIKGECPRCNAKDQYGDNCEVCGATYAPTDLKNPYSTLSGAPFIEKESEHYFFKLDNYSEFLKNWTRHGHLQEQVTNKLDEWFEAGLKEWDISRDAPYFGFKIPNEENKYFYVWLDAPVGYMASFKNLCKRRPDLNFDEYWAKHSDTELYHFIGKDIIYFHALFWPAILEGAQFRQPNAIYVNGFLTINGQKMSKSRGTFIKARTYLEHLNPEYLRYYLATKLSERIEDLDINFDDFLQRINSDLVGKFINIASRSASFLEKYFDGNLSAQCIDLDLFQFFANSGDEIQEHFEKREFSHAIRKIMALADRANQYFDEKKPWTLIKDEKRKSEVQDICSLLINLFRTLMIYLKPVLPQTALHVENFLNSQPLTWQDKESPLLNHHIKAFQPLITRIESKQIAALKLSSTEEKTATAALPTVNTEAIKDIISIDEFNKIDLRIAKIIQADLIPEADKLLCLTVDLGGETRQIFAGIKSAYEPQQLIGRFVVVVANLAPRKMRFGTSEGMVLAAGPGGSELWVISADEGVKAGMRVK